MAAIAFTDAAIEDLIRLGPSVAPRVLKKIMILEEDAYAGHPLARDLATFRKLVVGDNTWRVVYRIDDSGDTEICEIWAAGGRSDSEVYAEATARAHAAGSTRPELRSLAEVVQRLGRMASQIPLPAQITDRDAVPDWLAQRLIYTAGIPAVQVAAMSSEEATDAWTEYRMGSTG